MPHFRVLEYVESGKSFYADWFNSLDAVPAARIDRYVRRMEQGNWGDSKSVGEVIENCVLISVPAIAFITE